MTEPPSSDAIKAMRLNRVFFFGEVKLKRIVPLQLQKMLRRSVHVRTLIYTDKNPPVSITTKYYYYNHAERAIVEAERRKVQAEAAFNRR